MWPLREGPHLPIFFTQTFLAYDTHHRMNTAMKIATALGLVSAIYFIATKGKELVSEWAGKINFTIVKIYPLTIRINNPSPIYAPIDSVSIKIFYLKNNMYVPFASAPPTKSFNITPNSSTDITLHPS